VFKFAQGLDFKSALAIIQTNPSEIDFISAGEQFIKPICTFFANLYHQFRSISKKIAELGKKKSHPNGFFQFFTSLIERFFWIKQPSFLLVAFLLILTTSILVFNFINKDGASSLKESDRGVIGGPFLPQNSLALLNDAAATISHQNGSLTNNNSISDSENEIYYLIDHSSIQNPNPTLTSIQTDKNGLLFYKVQKGDTLLSIASDFGISLNTIIWANNLKSEKITPGEELIILPVSGILHEIKTGDTIETIAKMYSASPDKIIAFNNITNSNLKPGEKIIVPDGILSSSQAKTKTATSNLPSYPYYYVLPTTGFNWGTLHAVNAVDIANRCGTPVMASAEGLVILVDWDNGYGNHIKIQHPNNTETLYAHLNQIRVKEGDYVMQGELIGVMGNTGYVIGNPGCHLHFEIRGAKNPFVK